MDNNNLKEFLPDVPTKPRLGRCQMQKGKECRSFNNDPLLPLPLQHQYQHLETTTFTAGTTKTKLVLTLAAVIFAFVLTISITCLHTVSASAKSTSTTTNFDSSSNSESIEPFESIRSGSKTQLSKLTLQFPTEDDESIENFQVPFVPLNFASETDYKGKVRQAVNSERKPRFISHDTFLIPVSVDSSRTIKIHAPIHPFQLKHIVEKFPNLTNFTLDASRFCRESILKNRRQLNELHPSENISFKNVISFRVENGVEKECSLYPWIFKWTFPKLENLELFNMTLNEEVFSSVHELLERNKDTLKTITVAHSYICEDCYFSDVDYTRIEMIKILQQRTKP